MFAIVSVLATCVSIAPQLELCSKCQTSFFLKRKVYACMTFCCNHNIIISLHSMIVVYVDRPFVDRVLLKSKELLSEQLVSSVCHSQIHSLNHTHTHTHTHTHSLSLSLSLYFPTHSPHPSPLLLVYLVHFLSAPAAFEGSVRVCLNCKAQLTITKE